MAKKTTKRTTRAKSKQTATTEYKLPDGMALGLRSCKPDFTSPAAEANGFRWPRSGYVEAPDWIADKHCGHGLHLLAHGEGNGELICLQDGDPWLVCEYDPKLAVDLSGKIKVKECTVVFCGDRSSAPLWIMAHDPLARSVVSGTATAGYRGTATAGYSGTATAGDRGTARSGDIGIVVLRWYDYANNRHRLSVGYVGEDGIKPNTFYRCDDSGNLVKA